MYIEVEKIMTQQVLKGTKLVKFLKKKIRRVVANHGINPSTRTGDKELELLVKQFAKEPFTSFEQAENVANQIAKKIVALSQEKDKTNLDKGIIKQLSLTGELSSLVSGSTTSSLEKSKLKEKKTKEMTLVNPPKSKIEPTPEAEVETSVPEVEEVQEESTADPEPKAKVETPVAEVQEESTAEPEPKAEVETPVPEVEEEPTAELEVETSIAEVKEEPAEPTSEAEKRSESISESVRLKERLTEDIKTAMKAKDKIRLETIRSIKKAVLEKEVAVRPDGQETLTSEQELELLAQQAKQRRDSIEQYRQGGRDDLADKEAQELAIIETYLPAQASEEEISQIIDDIIADVGATSPKDMGKVMGPAMQQLKGKADGKKVQALVKAKLA